MSFQSDTPRHQSAFQNDTPGRRKGNKVFFGLFIILIGIAYLLRLLGLVPYFSFQEIWPWILVVFGLLIGFKSGFRSPAPFIIMGVGLFHIIPEFSFQVGERVIYSEHLLIPVALIGLGLFILFRSRKNHQCAARIPENTNLSDTLNVDVVFGGRKEIITSKDFAGGRATATFGGCDINLLQADTTAQNIVLNLNATFGGIELIIPAHWEVKNEISQVFGSVEDQRTFRTNELIENKKTLVLKGSCVFGGVEIKSF